MANKYDKKLILDYVSGNDIEDYDIDELENDYEFMMEVIEYTKDKNMYSLCSDEVKNNYMFVKFLIETFHEDIEFVVEVTNEYLNNHKEIDIAYKELIALISNLYGKEVDNLDIFGFKMVADGLKKAEYQYIKSQMEKASIEDKMDFGLGFLYIVDHYATSKILTDFFATEFINDIFYQNEMSKTDNKREVYNLEKLIHANTKNREDLNPERINNYIHDFIEPRDKSLAHHIANNLNLVEELKKDLTYVYNKWDYYMERLEARRRVILDDEIENIIKSHNIEVLFDVYELVNYILVSLGHQPIEDEFTIYNENSEVELIKKLKSGVELDYKEQMLVTYLTILIKKLYAKDIIDETPTDYNDYQKQDGELINVNFSAKK